MPTDNFNRADANPIGGNWTQQSGVGGVIELASNLAESVSGGESAVWWNANAPTADHYSQIIPVGALQFQGPCVRMQPGDRTFYAALIVDSTHIEIDRWLPGSITVLTTIVTSTITVGSSVIKLSVSGIGATVTLKLFLGGVQQGADVSDTDASRITSAGSFGFYSESNTAGRGVDDWEGGELTGPPPPTMGYLRLNKLRPNIFAPGLAR